ncbi:PadR family transcriptional regulator [filamentous cyanobacterium LEGE 11480]|uniref:PadR family transcriptional regulator n=1 Tax=Romeriopsis navalis LEGE 11480 TaxID=2777977 RepID=A0A928VR67_9CYAN|nr:PadR family transcriptional regulator [Romeriopsis navalis]MBE9030609.1 PadR family transcriptional regulator [Romeriopsis navalis LEGE 11480]
MALAHAILAVLTNRACSGYDLAKQFDGSVGFFWNASHQQIYRELTKLEDRRLVDLEVICQVGRPDKKLYSITDAGEALMREWIVQPSPLPPVKDELLIKLFVGQLVPKSEIQALLQQQRAQHEEILATYRTIEREYFGNPEALSLEARYQYLTLRNGIHFETGWLAWCDEASDSLS